MAALLLLLLACGADEAPGTVTVDPASAPPVASTPVPIDEDPCASPGSWARTGHPFVLTWCNGCHSAGRADADRYGAPAGVDFDSLADVTTWQARILARVEDGTMPPGGGPPATDRDRLAQWLACGAPGEPASLAGEAAALRPVGGVTVLTLTRESGTLEGATTWTLREGDYLFGSGETTRVVETWELDGADAWLWAREVRDTSGALVQRWSWDPPLPVGQEDTEAWTADVTLSLADADGAVSVTDQSWEFLRAPADPVDGWSVDTSPTRVLGLADDGSEEGWDLSDRYGVTARWSFDAEGQGLVYQQALEQDAGAFLDGFPLVEGDRRGGRIVLWEVAP